MGDPVSLTPIPQFTAPSYGDRTLNPIQLCQNLYTEKTPDGYNLIGRPGFAAFASTGVAGGVVTRGFYYSSSGQLFVADETKIWEISTLGVATSRGTIVTTSNTVVSWCDDGTDLLIATGATSGYTLVMSAGAVAAIADANFPANCIGVTYLNGYFIAAVPGTGRFRLSGLSDPTLWTPLTFATAEAIGDNLIVPYAFGGQLYLFGARSYEIWYNTGSTTFPFERVNGSTVNIGISGTTVGRHNGAIFIVSGSDGESAGSIWMINSGGPQKISPPYIEAQINASTGASVAFVSCYTFNGHDFVHFFGGSSASLFEYDMRMQTWCELTFSGLTNNAMAVINAQSFSGQYPVAVNILGGFVYQLKATKNADTTGAIVRRRIFGPIGDGTKRVFHSQIRIQAEILYDFGGTATSISCVLDWTDDGGLTYSTALTLTATTTASSSLGQIVTWTANRLGSSRGRYYRATLTGPSAQIILKKCELDLTEGRF